MRMAETSYEYINAVSHELRTPLTGMRGFLEVLLTSQQQPLPPPQQRMLTLVNQCSLRLENAIEDLLVLAEARVTGLPLVRAPVAMEPLIARTVRTARHAWPTAAVEIVVDVPDGTPTLFADPRRLERAITNLMGNAVKFSPNGGMVAVRCIVDAPDEVSVSVQDQGIGIPVAEQRQLFQRLFNASNAVDAGLCGPGLGLHVAKVIAEAHGGWIAVTSMPGLGTTATVTLPAVTAEQPRAPS